MNLPPNAYMRPFSHSLLLGLLFFGHRAALFGAGHSALGEPLCVGYPVAAVAHWPLHAVYRGAPGLQGGVAGDLGRQRGHDGAGEPHVFRQRENGATSRGPPPVQRGAGFARVWVPAVVWGHRLDIHLVAGPPRGNPGDHAGGGVGAVPGPHWEALAVGDFVDELGHLRGGALPRHVWGGERLHSKRCSEGD